MNRDRPRRPPIRACAVAILFAAVFAGASGAFAASQKIPNTQPGPLQQCATKLAYVAQALSLSRKYANVQSVTAACQQTDNKHQLAARNFLAAVVKADRTERKGPAGEQAARMCVAQVGRVAAILGVTGKNAEAKAFHDSCNRGRGRGLLASLDLLIWNAHRPR